MRKDKRREELRMTEHGVHLHPNTMFFKLKQKQRAEDYANHIRSYTGRCYNESWKWIGYYVPR